MTAPKGILDFTKMHNKPVNEHIGYACIECGEFFEWDEYAAMRCCGSSIYSCRYKRISDGKLFDLP